MFLSNLPSLRKWENVNQSINQLDRQKALMKCIRWGKHPVWPDWAKFCHFGKSLLVLGRFLTVYFLLGKMLSILLQICDIIVLIFITANGQILKNNLSIWSHCSAVTFFPAISKKWCSVVNYASIYVLTGNLPYKQCDQIGQFIGLWSTF